MRVTFVRSDGPDRMYVQRADGTESSWTFPSYGEGLPHDLVHLVVERQLGLRSGFWGLVEGGIDFDRINEAANRKGGKLADKYADLGDLDELMLAEMVSNLPWGREWFEDALETNAAFNDMPDREQLDAIAAELDEWRGRWRALPNKGALEMTWSGEASARAAPG